MMKTILLLMAAGLVGSTLARAQLPVSKWAKGFGGSGSDVANCINTDMSGNTIVTGSFMGSVDFSGSGSALLNSFGGHDVYVLKMDASGNFDWAANIGGTGSDEGFSVTTDVAGNIYLSGTFEGIVDFDPGTGTQFRMAAGRSDAFILKLDASGNFIWVNTFGGIEDDAALSIKLDAGGHVFAAGSFGDSVDFDAGATADIHHSSGLKDGFLLQLSSSGSFAWAKSFGGSGDDYVRSIDLDAGGNVLLAGSFQNTADFDPGSAAFSLTSKGLSDVFVLKLNTSGDYLWSVSKGGLLDDEAYGIAVDASGNVIITGMFSGIVDFDGGSGSRVLSSIGLSDAFILKLNASGSFAWAHNMGGLLGDIGNSVGTDPAGNIYVAGVFQGSISLGSTSLIAVGMSDAFLAKITSGGMVVWSRNVGSSTDDYASSVYVDPTGDIVYAGAYSGTADFGLGAGSFPLSAPGSNADIFAQRISQSGTYIDAINSVSTIMPYPNPCSGLLHLALNTESEVSVYNANGILVWQRQLGSGQQSIDLSSQPAGLYFLNLISTNKTAVENHRIQKF